MPQISRMTVFLKEKKHSSVKLPSKLPCRVQTEARPQKLGSVVIALGCWRLTREKRVTECNFSLCSFTKVREELFRTSASWTAAGHHDNGAQLLTISCECDGRKEEWMEINCRLLYNNNNKSHKTKANSYSNSQQTQPANKTNRKKAKEKYGNDNTDKTTQLKTTQNNSKQLKKKTSQKTSQKTSSSKKPSSKKPSFKHRQQKSFSFSFTCQ